jgi:hypothetical protein
VGKPRGKRPPEIPRRRWEDGIRMDLREIGFWGVDLTGSGQGPVAGCGECGDEPSGSCATELVSKYSTSTRERRNYSERIRCGLRQSSE